MYSKELLVLRASLQDIEAMSRIGRLQKEYQQKLIEEVEMRAATDLKNKRNREDLLQYTGILVFLIFLFLFVFYSERLTLSPALSGGIIFLGFVLLFEFVLVLLDPSIERITGGKPLFKHMANAGIAVFIIPMHNFFERKLRARQNKLS